MRHSCCPVMRYIEDAELAEVTPGAVWLRKCYLDTRERKRNERRGQAVAA